MNVHAGPTVRADPVSPVRGPDQPIRCAVASDVEIARLGAALARGVAELPAGLARFDPRRRTADNAARIRAVARQLAEAQQAGEVVTPAANWLLDNAYLVDEAIAEIRRDLPDRFYRQLPPLGDTGVPRVLAIAWLYVAHTDSAVSADGFRAMVEGFQEVEPLRIGEIWALPSLLRCVLVENLRRLAVRVARARDMRQLANGLADRIAAGIEDTDVAVLEPHRADACDPTFATQLLHRLRDGSQVSSRALAWLEERLEQVGLDAEEVTLAEHATLSAGNVTTGNIIRGLRLIDDVDWTVWFETVSRVDRLLRDHSDFEALDFPSRDACRKAIEQLAERSGAKECDVARAAIELASERCERSPDTGAVDVGCVVVGPQRPAMENRLGYRPTIGERVHRFCRRAGWPGLVVPVLALTVLLTAMAAAALDGYGLPDAAIGVLVCLFVLPASEAALGLFNTIVSVLVKPSRLMGYEFKDGIPANARTLVVVPILIGNRDDVEQAVHNLEVHYLSNMAGAMHFAILSDWPDSPREQTDADLALLDHARQQIAALNARHPGDGHPRFYLLHRRRLYNRAEGCWMGWERKRGKLHELNALLRGDEDTTFLAPSSPLPGDVRYVLTLDADTRMTRDTVTRLVGKMHHPLNAPKVDPATGLVGQGYAILQPRVTPSLTTGDEASFFQRVFSSNRGIDPYVFAVSDVYQDLFGDGSFTGKGLYHVDAMEAALAGRIPENTLLSHDLLEGAYARAALVSDVEVIEDYPTRYLVDASRQHRWARGDWQLLPWIVRPSSAVPGLSRWKMIDNLRRSLTPIAWVAASIAGWTLLPATVAGQWQALLVLSLFLSLTFGLVDGFMPRSTEVTLKNHFANFVGDVAFASAQVAFKVVLMAHLAWSMADAMLRTAYRLLVSRRHLLEWRTASQVARSGTCTIAGHYRAMGGAVVIAALGLALPLSSGSTAALIAAAFAVFWAGSPVFAWLVSRSAETEDRLEVRPQDARTLRLIARRTWLYFETFVTAEHNMLPPDNYQETPDPVVAGRTSPTNIGVYLLSVVSARDFGWISLTETIDRLERTLTTVEAMERHRGHLYNWYDTRTLEPLHPHYISSVDSGNLAGHLVAVASACAQWAEAPAAHVQGDFEGIIDAADILSQCLAELADDRRSLRPLRQRLAERIQGMHRAVAVIRNEPETAAIRTINLTVLAADIRKLAGGLDDEIGSDASAELSRWASRLERTCEAHLADSHTEEGGVGRLRSKLRLICDRARRLAFGMDFTFLLRRDRKLLSIGYRVGERQLDEACYDMLASEARLTSLFGIAKGDLPTEHWFRLGRPVTQIGFSAALVSWSGSMFEYLMPPLVMKEPIGGILNQTSNQIVRRQIAYGAERKVPWGISESAYNARDREMTYQYTNFGVPGLGLKRGLSQELVVAPYASLLAAQFQPRRAVENLARLAGLGARGRYGFYDAVDFTPGRVPEGRGCAVVRNFMAHHHGMSIVAVANVVHEGRMRDRFHADPAIEAAELLLQEKAPRNVPATPIRTDSGERMKPARLDERPDSRLVNDPLHAPRAVNLMSNGHYNVMVTATGTGYSRADEIAVTRWSGDPVEDRTGTFLFVSDPATGAWWSATAEPKRAPDEVAHAFFSNDKASFTKTVGTVRSEVECVVVTEGNGEARRITLWNDADEDRHLDVTSFAELALNFEAADAAHPAFSKMFVKTEIAEDGSMILATRRKRNDGDPSIALAHFVTGGQGVERSVEAETDRRAFIGRGRSIADAAAFDRDARLGGGQGFVLDPVMALRCRVRVPARRKVSLTFWTIVAADRDDIVQEAARHRHADAFQRQAMLAWTRSQVQARHVGLSLAQAAGVQKLAGHLLFPGSSLRAPAETIADTLGRQSTLWPLSISGDFPIFVLRVAALADLDIVATALRMQEYVRARGLLADLVIVNEQASSYVQDLQNAIELACDNARLRGRELGPRQHIFAVRRDLMDDASYRTLIAAARVVLHARNGTILDQIERAEAIVEAERSAAAQPPVPAGRREDMRLDAGAAQVSGEGLTCWNGYGGFADGGRAYVVRLGGNDVTPQPWINVVANNEFGFHTSAEGASFTWSRNSRDFQLTPWTNDPVSNRPVEAFYLHDRDSGEAFSPQACVLRDASLVYEARHEPGVSTFGVGKDSLEVRLEQVVDPEAPVKVQRLSLRNGGTRRRRLRVYGYAEWLLGNSRARSAGFLVPAWDAAARVLTARNPYHPDFAGRTAFFACDAAGQTFTSDRASFLGAGGATTAPSAVVDGENLPDTIAVGGDVCAAIAADVVIEPGEERHLLFVLGDAASQAEAVRLAQDHLAPAFDERLVAVRGEWRRFGEIVQVETPDPAFDAMVNVWLPYQSLACRLRARSAFYQASGAYGFRDQLQDTLALLHHDPSLARAQIVNAASRQFPEGDVQHWWLPLTGAGVRTTISDDVVWLAHATHRYVTVTGDRALLDVELPFIDGPALEAGAHDAFFTPERGARTATLYEHCACALDLAVSRTGANGLPLMLGGDWNDGMNGVGREGRGESVWLGWFLLGTLRDFAVVAASRGDRRRADAWNGHAGRLAGALEAAGWDGAWYRRGTYDDGTPLGSARSDECRIDSLAQSWSVIAGGADRERAERAVSSAVEHLVDEDLRIVRLFTPPFENTPKEPGYIKSYPPGVRENGGQYTHGAVWLVIALARLGRADEAWSLFSMLNPVNHALDRASADLYRVEPYVVAADIYSQGDRAGRGGWTWYTGSAGWLYRAAVEEILGIRREGDLLHVDPRLPRDWPGCAVTLRIGEATCSITIERGTEPGAFLDGGETALPFTLPASGEHAIRVVVAPAG